MSCACVRALDDAVLVSRNLPSESVRNFLKKVGSRQSVLISKIVEKSELAVGGISEESRKVGVGRKKSAKSRSKVGKFASPRQLPILNLRLE